MCLKTVFVRLLGSKIQKKVQALLDKRTSERERVRVKKRESAYAPVTTTCPLLLEQIDDL